jgi:N-acetylglutamate synthase-like GNAT family acetyltransferase
MDCLIIRPAKGEDAKAIEDMIYRWMHWQLDRVETIRRAIKDENHDIIVAEMDGKIVGVLHQIFHLDILHAGLNSHIILLLVDEEYRGRGVGAKLLKTAIEKAKEKGALEAHVDTILYMEAADFYRKQGFKDDGVYLELNLQK